jgi:NADH-quinone oxidoreductase subunit G
MSLEGNIMVARLQELIGAGTLCYFDDEVCSGKTLKAVSLLTSDNRASQEDVRNADMIVIIECDLLNQAPMMALGVRQAFRSGARIFIVENNCPNDYAHHLLYECVSVSSMAHVPYKEAVRPVVICGTSHIGPETFQAVMSGAVKLSMIMDGPNTFGCALLTREHGAISVSKAIADGRVKGIISFEADLPESMLEGISVIGAADWQSTGMVSRAEVFLPSTAWVEQGGTFVNHEGRAQRFKQVMRPGLPIKGLDPSGHPSREHHNDAPGGAALPSDRLITMLLQRFGDNQIEEALSGTWVKLRGLEPETQGAYI